MYKRVSNRDAATYIETRQEFETHTGSLRGEFATVGNLSRLGYLPPEHRVALGQAWDKAGRGVYIVWSYGTPIAWHDGERWTRPDVKYSVTTSRHQGLTPRDGTRTIR